MEKRPNHASSSRPRRQYEPPAVEETGDFERLILLCNHEPDGLPSCTSPPPDMGYTVGGTS